MSSAGAKARFSEAMWFAHGEQESRDAQAPDSDDVAAKNTLPIEERYRDDGSLSAADAARLSLRTGGTAQVPSLKEQPRAMEIPARELLDEARARSQMWIVAAIAIALIAAVVAFAL